MIGSLVVLDVYILTRNGWLIVLTAPQSVTALIYEGLPNSPDQRDGCLHEDLAVLLSGGISGNYLMNEGRLYRLVQDRNSSYAFVLCFILENIYNPWSDRSLAGWHGDYIGTDLIK